MSLWARLQSEDVGGLWVTAPANVRYLSGFSSPEDARLLIWGPGEHQRTFYTDERYTVQAGSEVAGPVFIGRQGPVRAHAAPRVAGRRLGFEAEHLSVAGLGDLQAAWPDTVLVPLRGVIEGLRLIKVDSEIDSIRRAQAIADAAFAEILPMILPGVQELEIALTLETAMRRRGAQAPAFDTIVASGVRGALPHGRASEKLMADGELVTIDFGAQVAGYRSDCTRTVPCGTISDPELFRLYRAVLEAQQAAVAAITPGVRTADLDAAAREVLGRHELAGYFTHSLGHGVGLDIHEAPGMRSSSPDVLQAGMVITIEPGVYLPGVGGVRIEELVLVTAQGCEVLSKAEKWNGQ